MFLQLLQIPLHLIHQVTNESICICNFFSNNFKKLSGNFLVIGCDDATIKTYNLSSQQVFV